MVYIFVIKKATSIDVPTKIQTSKETFPINAEISPADATNPILKYTILTKVKNITKKT